jgi:phosphopantetheinyl transferase
MKYSVIYSDKGSSEPAATSRKWPEAVIPNELATANVVIWCARISELAGAREWLDARLVGADLAPIEAANRESRKDELRLGRALLRDALRHFGFATLATQPVVPGEHGRPRFSDANAANLEFSISHAGDWVAVAIARDANVGLDLEQTNRKLNAALLGPRILDDVERNTLAQLNPANAGSALLHAWVGKEAVLKAIGKGLHGVTKSVRVIGCETLPKRTDPQSGLVTPWCATWLPVGDDVLTCLATPTSVGAIWIRQIRIETT